MGAELMKLTNNSSCRVIISVHDDNDEDEKIRQFVKENLEDGVQEGINVTLIKGVKQHEESQNDDFVDILLKVYQDYKAEFKISRTHLKLSC
ncbi:hypothetical protein CFP56_007304 [Quercus suber]|uniref:Uncharacterized protein n=1 Tax=Quercus suber TaxID=58331 RepID=A0AAW0L764_QUESU